MIIDDDTYYALLERCLVLEARLGHALALVGTTQAQAYTRGRAEGIADSEALRRRDRASFTKQAGRMRRIAQEVH